MVLGFGYTFSWVARIQQEGSLRGTPSRLSPAMENRWPLNRAGTSCPTPTPSSPWVARLLGGGASPCQPGASQLCPPDEQGGLGHSLKTAPLSPGQMQMKTQTQKAQSAGGCTHTCHETKVGERILMSRPPTAHGLPKTHICTSAVLRKLCWLAVEILNGRDWP